MFIFSAKQLELLNIVYQEQPEEFNNLVLHLYSRFDVDGRVALVTFSRH